MARLTQKDGTLIRVTRGALPVTVGEAKVHLRVDHDLDDDYIESLILAVQDDLEPPVGWLRGALLPATYRLILPKFAEQIELPTPPLIAITSVKYLDNDVVEQTAAASLYRVLVGRPSVIQLLDGKAWPDILTADDAVRIEYTAGNATLPEDVKAHIFLAVGLRYTYRSLVMAGAEAREIPGYSHMLASRRWS